MYQYCNRTNETNEKMTEPIYSYSYSSNNIYDARMSQFCVAYLNQSEHVINNETTLQRPKCTISPINPLATTISTTTTNHDEDFHLPHLAPSIVLSDETFTHKIPSISHLMHDSGISSMLSSSASNSSSTSFILSNSTNHSSPSNSYLNNSSYLNNITNSRPTQSHNYLTTTTTTTSTTKSQFQSTPNKSSLNQTITSKAKSKCNFHSILDLAQSSQTQTLPPPPLKIVQEQTQTNVTSSFNENLKQMSLALQNKENTLPSSTLNTNMKRKPRTQITKKQKEILDYAFTMKSYPDAHEVEYLCHLLGFEENVIRVSFKLYFLIKILILIFIFK